MRNGNSEGRVTWGCGGWWDGRVASVMWRGLVFSVAVVLAVGGCTTGGGESRVGQSPPVVETTAGSGAPGAVPSASERRRRVVPRVPAGVWAGYMVFDRAAGKVTVRRDAHQTVRSASVVKILIALDYLESRREVPAGDLALLRGMLRSSDDRAATVLWTRGGRRAVVARMVKRLRLVDTAPPPADRPGYWGYTAISAHDVVKVYRYLLERARPEVRDVVLGELRKATRCGTDGFDQYFGIPRAVRRPWAVKQGWSGFGTVPAEPCGQAGANGLRYRPAAAPDLGLGRPVLHTTGTVGEDDRHIVVVLTLHPAGSSFRAASGRLTALTRQVLQAGGI